MVRVEIGVPGATAAGYDLGYVDNEEYEATRAAWSVSKTKSQSSLDPSATARKAEARRTEDTCRIHSRRCARINYDR